MVNTMEHGSTSSIQESTTFLPKMIQYAINRRTTPSNVRIRMPPSITSPSLSDYPNEELKKNLQQFIQRGCRMFDAAQLPSGLRISDIQEIIIPSRKKIQSYSTFHLIYKSIQDPRLSINRATIRWAHFCINARYIFNIKELSLVTLLNTR